MSRKIKILYTIPNFDTAGSGKVVYDLVKGLDKTKFEPEICVLHTKGAYFKEVERLDVPIHVFEFETNYKPYVTFPLRVLKIARFFKKHRFDIIHSWHWSSDFSEPLAAKLAGIPYVYTKKAMSWGNKAWLWRSQLSTKIIYINRDMGTQFFSTMKEKTVQLPLGVDTDYFRPIPKKNETPEGIEIGKKDFVIVTVANLVPVKGIEVLLQAVNLLKDPTIKMLVVGANDNDYGKQLMKENINQNILFLGKKKDVRPYLALADLFVIPTKNEGRKEGMPVAPIEAMAMGKIVLGSNISGIFDVLNSYNDFLFEPGNVEDLKRKIQHVQRMSLKERKEMGEEVRSYVLNNLSISRFIEEREKFYIDLLK